MTIKVTDPEAFGFSTARLGRIKPAMQNYIDQTIMSGIITLIARKGQVVHFEQVGYADTEAQKPMTAETIFRIYSMTKPIICTALMALYEHGRFQLTDPLAKYIPAFASPKVLEVDGNGEKREVDAIRPITIHQLFTHTAGLTYDFLIDSPVSAMYREAKLMYAAERTLEEVILEVARFPLAYQPGTRWHYSVSIDVLAYLIEVLSGQPLADYLQQTIFEPLGMADTAFYVPAEKQDRLAAIYGPASSETAQMSFYSLMQDWQTANYKRLDLSTPYPADKTESFVRGGLGLFSTTADYLRFAQMLLNQGELDGARIIGRKTAELMHSNHLPLNLLPYEIGGIPSLGYGFGLGSRVLL
ncbi:MAG: beta-lactamase family protein, partial [Anaerolineales bacterium]|nr:beta-lactamase family protein [Anaerolineales bacterium]